MSPSNKPHRQRAVEKTHGSGANPTQLGDPVSLGAENTDTHVSTSTSGDGGGGHIDAQGFPTKVRTPPPSSGGSHEEKKLRGGHHVRGMMTEEIRQGKASPPAKSLEGDPTSLEAETTRGGDPVGHDNGPSGSRGAGPDKKGSKL